MISENGETLVWSGEDLKCCFYVFKVPQPRRKWMAFAAPVARSCFFPGSTGVVYLCSKVVPMGWISATGVIQHVQRRVLTSTSRHLRCLDPAAEVGRDRPLLPENSSTTISVKLCCPTRGKVSKAINHWPQRAFRWEGHRRLCLATQHFGKPISCLKLVQRHEPWSYMRVPADPKVMASVALVHT